MFPWNSPQESYAGHLLSASKQEFDGVARQREYCTPRCDKWSHTVWRCIRERVRECAYDALIR